MTALEEIKKAEHERIWLEPAEQSDPFIGRSWCQDNQWGHEGVEYVLASTLESLQRENANLKKDRYDLAYAITGGEDAPGLLDSVPTSHLFEIARNTHRSHSADIDRAEAAEAEVNRYRVALIAAKTRMRNCRGAIESDQVIDKDVHGSLQNGIRDIQEALASTGGEHHAE